MATPVIVRNHGTFRTEIEAGPHTFIADEPKSAGGNDEGPTPYDLLASALGACTSMTLHFYAKREGIPLEGVEAVITNDRMYAKDCADCATAAGYIHRFDVKLKLLGELTQEQREKLLGIARRCPVYKTLTSEIRIEEALVSG
ncbi:MAG TPA: OsmC family protein [Thermoanaerobaculia bacterium]|jgi:putative redox protein|nr:OsmC family protein [Thermoanaerobaculia bacterium]